MSQPGLPLNVETSTDPTPIRPDYRAHPLLDPQLFVRDRYARVHLGRQLRNHLQTGTSYAQLLNRLLHPIGTERPVAENERALASYFQDASRYVRGLTDRVPAETRAHFAPDREVEACNDLPGLVDVLFRSGRSAAARRQRFEAQRKLYLTRLLIQIDNNRVVQDGPRHREYLLNLMDREMWLYTQETRAASAEYLPQDQDVADLPTETWQFQVRRVVRQLPGGTCDLDIYHFDTRFKRESGGYAYTPGQSAYEVAERPLYDYMKRGRSGSILSKMLRKQINDPGLISDMLGMKFIVESDRHVHHLVDTLHQVLGGPFLFRNQVDLFRRPEDRSRLNRFSSPGFQVFKEDLDIFFPAEASRRGKAYLFGVELQIFTVDSFLRTVHSRDYVSHTEYKRRQFLRGVLPYVFPEELYGPPLV